MNEQVIENAAEQAINVAEKAKDFQMLGYKILIGAAVVGVAGYGAYKISKIVKDKKNAKKEKTEAEKVVEVEAEVVEETKEK